MFQYLLKRLWSVKNKSFYGYGLKKIRTPRYNHVTMTLKYDKIATPLFSYYTEKNDNNIAKLFNT